MIDKTKKDSELISAWLLTIGLIRPKEGLPNADSTYLLKVLHEAFPVESGISINDYLDIYDIPGAVYGLCENDSDLRKLNDTYSSLNREFKKLLSYIIKGHDVKNICLSMGYDNQDIFWKNKDECLIKLTGSKEELSDNLKSGYSKIIDKYAHIRDVFLEVTDGISDKSKRKSSKKGWLLTGSITAVIASLFFILIFPLLIQKDFVVLFDYGVEKSGYTMSIDSTELLEEMILDVEEYSPEYHWLLSLKALQEADPKECRKQLKELYHSDPVMYAERGKYIYRRLK